MWKHLWEKSFPMSEGEYNDQLDAVAWYTVRVCARNTHLITHRTYTHTNSNTHTHTHTQTHTHTHTHAHAHTHTHIYNIRGAL
jgi:hypothetical protein